MSKVKRLKNKKSASVNNIFVKIHNTLRQKLLIKLNDFESLGEIISTTKKYVYMIEGPSEGQPEVALV